MRGFSRHSRNLPPHAFRIHPQGDGDTLQSVSNEKTNQFAWHKVFEEYIHSKPKISMKHGNPDRLPAPPEAASADGSTTHDIDGTSKSDRAPSSSPQSPRPAPSGIHATPTSDAPTPNSPWVKHTSSAETRRSELFVDDVLKGKLPTDDNQAAIWVGHDGIVVFGRRTNAFSDGQQAEFKKEEVLITPWPKKVEEFYRARAILMHMEAEEKRKDKRRTEWTYKELKIAKTARNHLGEVNLVLTNRGCLVS